MTAPQAAAKVSWWRRLVARHDMRLVPAAAAVWLVTLLGIECGWGWTVVSGVGLAVVSAGLVMRGRRVRFGLRRWGVGVRAGHGRWTGLSAAAPSGRSAVGLVGVVNPCGCGWS